MELKIRKLKEKDAPLMLEWMHDPDVVAGMRKDFSSFTIDHCLNFIAGAQADGTAVHRAVVNEEDEYLGTVSVRDIDKQLGCGEFAITVRRKAMGTGAAIFGMREILNEALNELGLNKIYWCVSAGNPRAVRFYRKNRFTEVKEGRVPDYLTKGYGKGNDLLWFCYEQKPCISVIVTSYKNVDEAYDSFESILKQTYPCVELILTDDCTPDFDQYEQKLNDYVAANRRSNLISFVINRHAENQGTVKNINSALKIAKGTYMMVIGAGDMLSEPQTLEVYEAFMRNSTKYVCFGKLRGVTPEGEYKYELLSCDTDYDKLKQFDARQTLNHLFKRNYLPAPAAFYKAAVFEKFGYHDEEIRLIEDYPYWMMLAQSGETFGYLDHYTVEYKLSGVTSSGEYSAGFMKDLCLIYEKYIYPYDQRFGIGQKFYNALKQGGLNYYSTRAVFKNMTKGQKAAAYVKYAPFYAFTTLQQKMNDLKNRKASADHDRHD